MPCIDVIIGVIAGQMSRLVIILNQELTWTVEQIFNWLYKAICGQKEDYLIKILASGMVRLGPEWQFHFCFNTITIKLTKFIA